MEDVEISERPDKIDENDQRMDRDDDHQIITLGHIPKSCDAEFIQCGDGLSSGTNEVNIKISKKHATRLEDGKLIPLDRMSWWEPNNECWQYFLNEICEDYFYKCLLLKKINYAFCLQSLLTKYRIRNNSLQSNRLRNIFWIWKINKKLNKLNFFQNLISIFFISINSLLKYGLK